MPRPFLRRLLAISCFVLVFSAANILAEAAEEDDSKPLIDWNFDEALKSNDSETGVLALGNDGQWSAKIEDGEYVVANHDDKDAVRYVQLGLSEGDKPLDLSVSSVDVDVDGTFEDNDSGAGVLYRFDPEGKTYLAFVLTKDGYQILKRDESGLQTVSQGAHSYHDGATLEVNTLDSGEVEFRIDDKVVGSIDGTGFEGNHAGMIAIGRGEFYFDNFQVYSPDAE